LTLPRVNSPACLRRQDTLPRCFCPSTESPVARGGSLSSGSRTRRLLWALSRSSMAASSMAGIFASQRPRIARGLLWEDRRLPGMADTKRQSRKAAGGISEARSAASRRRQAKRCWYGAAPLVAVLLRNELYRCDVRREARLSSHSGEEVHRATS